LWRVGSHVDHFEACSVFTARYGPHDLLASLEKPFLGVLQSTCYLLDRPQCFRLGRVSPVGTSTRGFQTPWQGAHNNAVERALRPLSVGRKNWQFVGGDGGLPSASVLMSVCASAKRHELNPWVYLTDVLTELAAKPADVTNLLPDVWAKQHLPANY
jgi:hypothetical protein